MKPNSGSLPGEFEDMGRRLFADQPVLAPELAAHYSVLGLPSEIRRVIYTTNAIESVNISLRKITKNRGSFPNDDALL